MITGISIENFKGIRERVDLELKPITLLFGSNSAGKSSILHALQLAQEAILRNNPSPDETLVGGGSVNLGGFRMFVHNRSFETPVKLGFQISLDDPDVFFGTEMETVSSFLTGAYAYDEWFDCFAFFEQARIEIEIRGTGTQGAFLSSFVLEIEGEPFAEISTDRPGGRQVLRLNSAHPALIKISNGVNPDEIVAQGADPEVVRANLDAMSMPLLKGCLDALQELVEAIPQPDGIVSPWQSFFLDGIASVVPVGEDRLPFVRKRLDSDEFDQVVKRFESVLDNGSIYYFLSEVIDGISKLITVPLTEVVRFLESFRYLGPIREVPKRIHQTPSRSDIGRWASGLGAWDLLETANDAFIAEVGDWLGNEDRLNAGYRVAMKRFKELDLSDPNVARLLSGRDVEDDSEEPQIRLSDLPTQSRLVVIPTKGSIELRPGDIGIGISQVVPVIVTALDGKGRLLAIEQPELHLHPRIQAEIADLFIEACQKKHHRFLIETHSEHCILRLQRRIRETADAKHADGRELMSDDVVIYHVSSEEGRTGVSRIDLDRNGEFVQPWPDDFFEIDFYERFGHDR